MSLERIAPAERPCSLASSLVFVPCLNPFGLWERTVNGYTTNEAEDIERFMTYMSIERNELKNNPSSSQMAGFIDGEMGESSLGKLSDGSKLTSTVKVNGYKGIGGKVNWYTDQKSFDSFWHGVQGDLTPDALDTRTLHKNYLWTTYAGPNNPKTYRGQDDYSYNPKSGIEQAAIKHDLAYDALNIKGSGGLFNDKRAIGADWTYVKDNYLIGINPLNSPISRVKAFILGTGVGAGASMKTIEKYMPTMVNPPAK
jgi:hypothetical protein